VLAVQNRAIVANQQRAKVLYRKRNAPSQEMEHLGKVTAVEHPRKVIAVEHPRKVTAVKHPRKVTAVELQRRMVLKTKNAKAGQSLISLYI